MTWMGRDASLLILLDLAVAFSAIYHDIFLDQTSSQVWACLALFCKGQGPKGPSAAWLVFSPLVYGISQSFISCVPCAFYNICRKLMGRCWWVGLSSICGWHPGCSLYHLIPKKWKPRAGSGDSNGLDDGWLIQIFNPGKMKVLLIVWAFSLGDSMSPELNWVALFSSTELRNILFLVVIISFLFFLQYFNTLPHYSIYI